MMGERTVSRSAFEAGGSVFPMMGECGVSRAALVAGGSAFPRWGGACGAAEPPWPVAAPSQRWGGACADTQPSWPVAADLPGRGCLRCTARPSRPVADTSLRMRVLFQVCKGEASSVPSDHHGGGHRLLTEVDLRRSALRAASTILAGKERGGVPSAPPPGQPRSEARLS